VLLGRLFTVKSRKKRSSEPAAKNYCSFEKTNVKRAQLGGEEDRRVYRRKTHLYNDGAITLTQSL